MKVAIIRVPTAVDESASTAPICPPIGLAYLKSIVNTFTKDIQVIDSIGNKPEFRTVDSEGQSYYLLGQTAEEIVNSLVSDTDIILISVMFSQDWPYSKEVIRGIKNKCPKAIIVAGGEHITALPKYSLESAPNIDICVLGEGEKTLYTLLDYFNINNTFPKDLSGTYSNRYQFTEPKKIQKTEKIL